MCRQAKAGFTSLPLDLGSRRLAGWAMADHMRSGLVEHCPRAGRRPAWRRVAGSVFHSVHASQYLSGRYRALCERLGVSRSAGPRRDMLRQLRSRVLLGFPERELAHRYRFDTRAEAIGAITAWIHRYNSTRLHSSIGHVPPVE